MTDVNQRRAVFLAEMGVGPLWIHRASADADAATSIDANVVELVSPVVQVLLPLVTVLAPAQESPAPAPLPTEALAPQGLPKPLELVVKHSPPVASAWDDDDTVSTALPPAGKTPPIFAQESDIASMDWVQLSDTVAGCTKCGLCQSRTRTVFGTGDQKAKWLFVGEGPGRNEDVQGEPFVGPAGKLLDNMLLAIGLKRGENAYIANIVKCRPTDANGRDRAPHADEAAACMPYLKRQVALIKPTIIVALGKTAALSLLGLPPATPVSKLRGVVHRFADLPLIVTYHPAYLLRSLTEKRKSWEDLCLAMDTYASGP